MPIFKDTVVILLVAISISFPGSDFFTGPYEKNKVYGFVSICIYTIYFFNYFGFSLIFRSSNHQPHPLFIKARKEQEDFDEDDSMVKRNTNCSAVCSHPPNLNEAMTNKCESGRWMPNYEEAEGLI